MSYQVREEEETRKIEEALMAEAERRLLDEEERQRIIALARHLWNKGVRVSRRDKISTVTLVGR